MYMFPFITKIIMDSIICAMSPFFSLFSFSFGNYNHYGFLEFSEVITCLQYPVILPCKSTGMKKCGRFLDVQWPTKHGKSAIVLHATPCQS